jgi:hypothetical protein
MHSSYRETRSEEREKLRENANRAGKSGIWDGSRGRERLFYFDI